MKASIIMRSVKQRLKVIKLEGDVMRNAWNYNLHASSNRGYIMFYSIPKKQI
jgi:hypothetical protein